MLSKYQNFGDSYLLTRDSHICKKRGKIELLIGSKKRKQRIQEMEKIFVLILNRSDNGSKYKLPDNHLSNRRLFRTKDQALQR